MSAPTARAVHSGTAPLAALTSVLTPPCSTSWLLTTTKLFSQYPPFPTTGPLSCDPPSWRTNIANGGFHYYSPAICPRGFAVGPSCAITKTRTQEGFPAIAPGETAVYCVPIGLTCTTDITDYRGGVWGFARDATTPGALVTVGPAIQIRWAEADLTALETHPLTPGLKVARKGSGIAPTTDMEAATSTGPGAEPTSDPEIRPASDGGKTSEVTLITGTREPEESFSLIHETGRPTTTLRPASTAGSNSNGSGGLGSLNRTTSIVVIVIVTVVAGILLWVAAFLLVRRYKKKLGQRKASSSSRSSDESGLEQGRRRTRQASRVPTSLIVSPASELDAGPPAIGSTPNPAELEGDIPVQPPKKPWMSQGGRLKSPSLQPPQSSPRSMLSARSSARRTVRESFGEKINDPAAVLGRLRIPSVLSPGRPSPASASPSARSFWRMPRSPRSPSGARQSAQLPKPSPRSGFNVNASRASTPRRGKTGWQDDAGGAQRDATP